MFNPIIIAAATRANSPEQLEAAYQLYAQAVQDGLNCRTLHIDPLSTPWESPQAPDHFRSGCAPLEALARAQRLIRDQEADLVMIRGRDLLRSDYTSEQRQTLMRIYPEMSIPQAYNQLCRHFCELQGIDESLFLTLRDALFDNYARTATQRALPMPDTGRFALLTDLFRAVDCANPVQDFEGAVLVTRANNSLPQQIRPVKIRSVGIGIAEHDGPEHSLSLAGYHALEKAGHYAEVQLAASEHPLPGLQGEPSLAEIVGNPATLLEVYTCYPVVPLAFLLTTGAVTEPQQLLSFIQQRPLTVTGGMNLARGPWNNPALNGLIQLCHQLSNEQPQAVLHGNGGLGYRQGIAVLSL